MKRPFGRFATRGDWAGAGRDGMLIAGADTGCVFTGAAIVGLSEISVDAMVRIFSVGSGITGVSLATPLINELTARSSSSKSKSFIVAHLLFFYFF
jgi:hypothetical protein